MMYDNMQVPTMSVKGNADGIYKDGDVLTGSLSMNLLPPEIIDSVLIEAVGESEARWKNPKGHCIRLVPYERHVQFYYESLAVSGSQLIDQHRFSFEFHLPQRIPCSYDGPLGRVRYLVRASMQSRRSTEICVKEETFYIRNSSLASVVLQSQWPSTACTERRLWYPWCDEMKVRVFLRIPSRAIVIPGCILRPTAIIENRSRSQIRLIKLLFTKVVSYEQNSCLRSSMRTAEWVLTRQTLPGSVLPGTKRTWRNVIFPIPIFQVVDDGIVDQNWSYYYMQLTVEVSGPHKNFSVQLPVPVCDVPQSQTNS